MDPFYEDDRATLYHGDCLEVLRLLPDNLIDSLVTDPPYGLEFMGKEWDHGIPGIPFWLAALRVLKPGAHLVAFGGTRTHHRLWCALEDAGFEIRDTLAWMYGSGFPKSLDVSKAIDKVAGAEREVVGQKPWQNSARHFVPGADHKQRVQLNETAPATDAARQWDGWGTALKPAWEPIVLARKPLSEPTVAANVQRWGTGALNVDGCRIAGAYKWRASDSRKFDGSSFSGGSFGDGPHPAGRWPANVVLDKEAAAMLDEQSGYLHGIGKYRTEQGPGGKFFGGQSNKVRQQNWQREPGGGASRFFYCTKASKKERWFYCRDCQVAFPLSVRADHGHGHVDAKGHQTWGHVVTHPTVKPLKLMHWLCRLVTPPAGLVLDPFVGSGTTLEAAAAEGFEAIGIDLDETYCAITAGRSGAACTRRG